jgi:hypothetical protein
MEKLIEEMTNAVIEAGIVKEGISHKEIEDILIKVLARFLEN